MGKHIYFVVHIIFGDIQDDVATYIIQNIGCISSSKL